MNMHQGGVYKCILHFIVIFLKFSNISVIEIGLEIRLYSTIIPERWFNPGTKKLIKKMEVKQTIVQDE